MTGPIVSRISLAKSDFRYVELFSSTKKYKAREMQRNEHAQVTHCFRQRLHFTSVMFNFDCIYTNFLYRNMTPSKRCHVSDL